MGGGLALLGAGMGQLSWGWERAWGTGQGEAGSVLRRGRATENGLGLQQHWDPASTGWEHRHWDGRLSGRQGFREGETGGSPDTLLGDAKSKGQDPWQELRGFGGWRASWEDSEFVVGHQWVGRAVHQQRASPGTGWRVGDVTVAALKTSDL